MEYPSVLSAQDVADMMSFGRPAASAPAQKVAEAPPEAYLLHAVLVHVGGTQGGHYFAYVRPGPGVEGAACAGDAWVEFNDGEVREVNEGVVLSCCGCEEGAGMVKRSKAPTAYMLLYRARGVSARTSGVGVAVPAAARQIVEVLNASVRERREADAARLNRLECLVRWDPQGLHFGASFWASSFTRPVAIPSLFSVLPLSPFVFSSSAFESWGILFPSDRSAPLI